MVVNKLYLACLILVHGAIAAPVDFQRDIQPILAERCFECHGPDKQKNGLRLDRRSSALKGGESELPAFIPGKPQASHLIQLITSGDDKKRMPPKGARLTADQVAIITEWIEQGASYPAAMSGGDSALPWSYQPVRNVIPPTSQDSWIANPIDAFILDKLKARNLSPSTHADRVSLIRRLYLDMLGLPPTPAEVHDFVADQSPDAWTKLVEKVLASPRYGERWARHWLDVVRFAETYGYEKNEDRPNAWPYRDYVIQSFNEDKPYDRFVFEQIAGDTVGQDAATGFLVGGPKDQVGTKDPVFTAIQRQDELADMLNTTGTTFMGVTLGCARCHNHKFDPISQKEYYSLQAVFAGVIHGDRSMTPPDYAQKQAEAAKVEGDIVKVNNQLAAFEQPAFTGVLRFLQEGVAPVKPEDVGVRLLMAPSGRPQVAAGVNPGQREDPGDGLNPPNLSGGYSYWRDKAGQDLAVYQPQATGPVQIWISWGVHPSHDTQAIYLLDADGDLSTRNDQREIARIDQTKRADGGKYPEGQSGGLWSGLKSLGIHEMKPRSVLLLRAGSAKPCTADLVVMQSPGVSTGDQPRLPALRPPVNAVSNTERIAPVAARFVRFTIEETNDGTPPCIDELELFDAAGVNVALGKQVKLTSGGDMPNNAKHKLVHLNDGVYGNSRSWISKDAGRGWVQLDLGREVVIHRIVWGRDREAHYTDRLPTHYRIEAGPAEDRLKLVAGSSDRVPHGLIKAAKYTMPISGGSGDGKQADLARKLTAELQQLQQQRARLLTKPTIYAGKFEEPGSTFRLFRGDAQQPRESVAPDSIATLGPPLSLPADAPEKQRRIALANWLIRPDHPLTARVMVNRLWQYHFGVGFVDTPSDFGANGGKPTHPELLDWLAGQFVTGGWSIKKIHRLILLSNAYQQSSRPNPQGLAADAQSRLLWRYPPRRLEAEPIRDAMLAVSGSLDLRMGGPGFSVFKPNTNYVRVYDPKEEWGPAEWRRAIYMFKVRMEQDAVFGAFDCPDAGQVAPRRPQSTTPLQALNLLNSSFLIQQADLLARRLEKEAGGSSEDQIRLAFELAFNRAPQSEEVSASLQLVKAHGLPALCRAIYNSNEFLFIP